MIPIHRRPAADRPENAKFNATLSKLRVRSEHCMGALKGRWQCLRGLRVNINSNSEHVQACRWITIAIILHNMVIDVEGAASGAYFAPPVGSGNGGEDEDDEEALGPDEAEEEGEAKRRHLVQEINTFGR
ncbi:hypothetical protein CYLTODRAFT_264712 [Cylindrobasidium torrendii FP15055 ss-10]|uniref:DDE Tnp4 domain-containing protein n=1 Tax=Cylindrobasidium torrendii FP15055 ss-10 TaxID=1314674 RepID=A0A0D7AS90_9AGAR|nr:hypothetical protein CYLTODRAFT_264712 [Cylindrobasidium torrendii FP15055 ss-10]